MKKTTSLYLASVAGFAAAMALVAHEEDDPRVRRGKQRACALVPLWPLYTLAGAVSVSRRRRTQLLPDDAYPINPVTGKPMTRQARRQLDARLRAMLPGLPTEPGSYFDAQGDLWVLDTEGGWTDHQGVRKDARYAPVVAAMMLDAGSMPRTKEVGA